MFEPFCKTIDGLPPPGVRHFIGRVQDHFEEALLHKWIDETQEVHSILSFCQFMNAVFEDDVVFPLDGLPVRHIAFYGKVVTRLIEAGELPSSAKAKFDAVFSAGYLRSLTTGQMPP